MQASAAMQQSCTRIVSMLSSEQGTGEGEKCGGREGGGGCEQGGGRGGGGGQDHNYNTIFHMDAAELYSWAKAIVSFLCTSGRKRRRKRRWRRRRGRRRRRRRSQLQYSLLWQYKTVVLMGLGYNVLHFLLNKLEEEEEEIEEELYSYCVFLQKVSSTLEVVPKSKDGDLLHLTQAPWIPSLHSSITNMVPQCTQF